MKHADFSAGTKRRTLMLIALAAFACLGLLISVGKGSVDIPLTEITGFLLGAGNSPHGQIIYNIRLPRSIVAALVGINLALSGAILQAVMKNPLADPHIIGISSGAGLLGILVMLAFPGWERPCLFTYWPGKMGFVLFASFWPVWQCRRF